MATWGLDILAYASQNTPIPVNYDYPFSRKTVRFMTPSQPSQPTQPKVSREQCKHPQVQIVSRDEEAEYVECKECGEVFESSEFRDMEIEEKKRPDEE